MSLENAAVSPSVLFGNLCASEFKLHRDACSNEDCQPPCKNNNTGINCLLYFIITPQRVNLSCATTAEPTEHLGPITLAGRAVVILLRSFFQLQPYSRQVVTEDEFFIFSYGTDFYARCPY